MLESLYILAYHRVGVPDPKARYRGQYVTPRHLDFQISLLKAAGFEFSTLIRHFNAYVIYFALFLQLRI